VTVWDTGFEVKVSANRNSFQERVKEKSAVTTMAGIESGRMIRNSAVSRVQPSTRAASSSATGIVRKYPISSHVVKGT